MSIRVRVWNENVHERTSELVRELYPDGIHGALAAALLGHGFADVETSTLEQPEHGLGEAALAATDVLVWWGHKAHGDVSDAVVERVVKRVWEGMGLVVLHSGHFSKPFKRLMGSPCALKWREAGEVERVWTVNPGHPIAEGLPRHFDIAQEEMYGEPFSVPEPMETVFISWFEGGEVFRSGLTWRRGAGKIFYFRPGHEAYPTYRDPNVLRVVANGVRWAHNPAPAWSDVTAAPNVPVDKAPSKIVAKGASLHKPGEGGFR
ncbi:MAG: ThuA domain-containing protein [Bradyrhizobium sp.]|nr:ThuA domain-containing protein [Bradyrhizobium sp.]MDE2016340.1 ThuA domain-containing protein [Hyphomicrobiales bacterium]